MIRVYPLLLVLEAAGAVVILWHGVPIYRSLLADTFVQQADVSRPGAAAAIACPLFGRGRGLVHRRCPRVFGPHGGSSGALTLAPHENGEQDHATRDDRDFARR